MAAADVWLGLSGTYRVYTQNNVRRHKQDTATFKELDFAGQARSINATVLQVKRQFRAHLRRAIEDKKDVQAVKAKMLGVIERALDDLR